MIEVPTWIPIDASSGFCLLFVRCGIDMVQTGFGRQELHPPVWRRFISYVPGGYRGTGPLMVMFWLHPDADDFAAGTQMNRLAEENFIVLYPEMILANINRCWFWTPTSTGDREPVIKEWWTG